MSISSPTFFWRVYLYCNLVIGKIKDITDYHAKYYAYELTKRCSSYSLEKLISTLVDAQVDLNPHQIDASLFAFRSPFSKGVILADEVGLGKTYRGWYCFVSKMG